MAERGIGGRAVRPLQAMGLGALGLGDLEEYLETKLVDEVGPLHIVTVTDYDGGQADCGGVIRISRVRCDSSLVSVSGGLHCE